MTTVHYAAAATGSGSGADASNLKADASCTNMNALVAGDIAILYSSEGDFTGQIKPANSGTVGNVITYQAASGETPRIYKGHSLTGWTKVSGTDGVDAIYKIQYGTGVYDPIQLLVDDYTIYPVDNWRASHPKDGIFFEEKSFAWFPAVGISKLFNRNDPASKTAESWGSCTTGDTTCLGANGMFTHDGTWLYARMPAGDDPDTHTVTCSSRGAGTGNNGFQIEGRSYITITGINTDFCYQPFEVKNTSSNIIIQDCEFNYSKQLAYIGNTSYFYILRNVFEGSGIIHSHSFDAFNAQNSSYGLVQGNTSRNGAHAAFVGENCHHMVFDNCDSIDMLGKGFQFRSNYNQGYRNIIQNCRAARTAVADDCKEFHYGDHDGITTGGNTTLARWNQVWDCANGITTATNYTDNTANDNRIVHNTVYGGNPTRTQSCSGILLTRYQEQRDIKILNNLVMDTKHGYAGVIGNVSEECFYVVDGIANIATVNADVRGNNFFTTSGVTTKLINEGTIAAAEASYGAYFSSNITADPLIGGYNPDSPDFSIGAGSGCIEAGVPIALTVGSYSGSTLVVDDPYVFFDGFGLTGMVGDEITVGANSPVTITNVDDATSTITHDGTISGASGEAVHYTRNKPTADSTSTIGVFAYDGTPSVDPPVNAINDVHTCAQDSSVADVDVLANDYDVSASATITAYTYTSGNGATVAIKAGSLLMQYTPAASFSGSDSFTYTMSDGVTSDTATVNVTVTATATTPTTGTRIDNLDAGFGATGDFAVESTLTNEYSTDYEIVGEKS